MPIAGFENLKPKQLVLVVVAFAASSLFTLPIFSVLQAAGFGLVVGVFALSFFLTLNDQHQIAEDNRPVQSNRAQELIAKIKDYQTPGANRAPDTTHPPDNGPDSFDLGHDPYGSEKYGSEKQEVSGFGSKTYESETNGSEKYASEKYGSEQYGSEKPSAESFESESYSTPNYGSKIYQQNDSEQEHEDTHRQSALERAMIARQRAEAQVAAATGEAPSSYLGAKKSAVEQLSAGVLASAAAASAPIKDEPVHIEYDNFSPSQLHSSAISDQQFDQSLLEALPTAISSKPRVNTSLYKHREHKCWKCKEMMYLYTWKGHEMWSQVPPPEPKPDSIQYRYYQTIAAKYWANVCPKCDTVQGDHLIFEDMPPALWENID